MRFAREEIVPPHPAVLRQQGSDLLVRSPGGHGPEDGPHEQRPAEQKGVVGRSDGAVGGKSHAEGLEHGCVLGGDTPGDGIDERRQAVTQADILELVAVEHALPAAELPRLARNVGAVGAEDGQKSRELEPTGVEVEVIGVGEPARIGSAVGTDEEPARIDRPPRKPRSGQTDARGELPPEIVPRSDDVARPDGRAEALLPGERRTGEEERPAVGLCVRPQRSDIHTSEYTLR